GRRPGRRRAGARLRARRPRARGCRRRRRSGRGSCGEAQLAVRGLVDEGEGTEKLLFAGVAAETEPDGRARLPLREAERGEDVARAAGAAGAGGAGGEGDLAEFRDQAGG